MLLLTWSGAHDVVRCSQSGQLFTITCEMASVLGGNWSGTHLVTSVIGDTPDQVTSVLYGTNLAQVTSIVGNSLGEPQGIPGRKACAGCWLSHGS